MIEIHQALAHELLDEREVALALSMNSTVGAHGSHATNTWRRWLPRFHHDAMIPSYWPTPLQELHLRAALLPGEDGLGAWRRACAIGDGTRRDAACESLLPLVYGNLARYGDAAIGIDALKERYLDAWSENQRRFHHALALLQAFEGAGIDAIALKGLALIARFYRDPGVRPMADVDVLVRPDDVHRAVDAALGLGWRPRHHLTPEFLRVKHAGPLEHPMGVACDLHWRVFEEPGATGMDDDFRRAAESLGFQGARLRVLRPTDQLLHVLGHAGRWSQGSTIRWVADAMTILREGPIDWRRFVRHTVERRFILRVRQMLRYLCQHMSAEIPGAVEADLAGRPVSLLERLEHRVRSREQRLFGELPTYVFNCLRGEPRPLRALPGYLRDAWELPSLAGIPRRALILAARRVKMTLPGGR